MAINVNEYNQNVFDPKRRIRATIDNVHGTGTVKAIEDAAIEKLEKLMKHETVVEDKRPTVEIDQKLNLINDGEEETMFFRKKAVEKVQQQEKETVVQQPVQEPETHRYKSWGVFDLMRSKASTNLKDVIKLNVKRVSYVGETSKTVKAKIAGLIRTATKAVASIGMSDAISRKDATLKDVAIKAAAGTGLVFAGNIIGGTFVEGAEVKTVVGTDLFKGNEKELNKVVRKEVVANSFKDALLSVTIPTAISTAGTNATSKSKSTVAKVLTSFGTSQALTSVAAKSIDSVFEAKNNKKLFNGNVSQNIVGTMIHTKMKPQSTKSVAIGAGLIGADLILNSMKKSKQPVKKVASLPATEPVQKPSPAPVKKPVVKPVQQKSTVAVSKPVAAPQK